MVCVSFRTSTEKYNCFFHLTSKTSFHTYIVLYQVSATLFFRLQKMPRARDPKMKKYHEIAMAEWKRAKARKESGEMSAETFKKNFRGAVALRSGKAYSKIKTEYHAWLKKNGHPIPKPAPLKKKKKKQTKKKQTSEKKK